MNRIKKQQQHQHSSNTQTTKQTATKPKCYGKNVEAKNVKTRSITNISGQKMEKGEMQSRQKNLSRVLNQVDSEEEEDLTEEEAPLKEEGD